MKYIADSFKNHTNYLLVECETCFGMGHIDENECQHCNATGYLQLKSNHKVNHLKEFNEAIHNTETSLAQNGSNYTICRECQGMGQINDLECFSCDASGLIKKALKLVKKTPLVQSRKLSIKCNSDNKCETCVTNISMGPI